MAIDQEWFKTWKERNGHVRWRIGFVNKFIIDYAEKEELDWISAKHKKIRREISESGQPSWRWRYALNSVYRDYRVILRARHARSFDSSQIYKCFGSGVYADVLEGPFGKASLPSYMTVKKNDVLMWVSRDEANRNTFMYDNTLIRISGTRLDKIRKIEKAKE